ncbi:MAG TPA: L-threonylcarbamoyladenylate synthase [bacterium]|nr:L-threonylcarbamoyladenylate synthase [bacterium]
MTRRKPVQDSEAPKPPARVIRFPWDDIATAQLRQALQDGALMTYPTETSYALGGNALLPQVTEAVYALKGRPADKALLLLVDGATGLTGWVREVTPAAEALMDHFWPGPLTLVFQAGPTLPAHLADARGTVALRWSPHPLIAALLRLGAVPLIGTSANPSGTPSLHSVDEVLAAFPQGIDLALNGGHTSGGAPSTLVDTTVSPPQVLREGAIPRAALQAALPNIPLA